MLENKYFELGDFVTVYDKEFESSLSFDKDLLSLGEAYGESPEYFTNNILVSIYHYIITNEQLDAREIVGDIESEITGRCSIYDTEYLLNLIEDGYDWIHYDIEEQIETLADNILSKIIEN